jgi:hypothetical protein
MWNGVKGVHYIHLKHHPIEMDIQNNLKTINHWLTTTSNYHAELMQQQVKRKHIAKL